MKITPERNDIKDAISMLEEMSKGDKAKPVAKRLYELVAVPKRKRISVNLYKIDKYTKEGDNVIVPGKVLGTGKLGHKVTITAIEYSRPAKEELKKAGCEIKSIDDIYKMMEGSQKVSAKIIV